MCVNGMRTVACPADAILAPEVPLILLWNNPGCPSQCAGTAVKTNDEGP